MNAYAALKAPESMEILRIDDKEPDPSLMARVASIAMEGGLIAYPTDTVYGLGTILEVKAVSAIFSAKKRAAHKPLSIVFSDMEQLREYCDISPGQGRTIEAKRDLGTTFILDRGKVPDFITGGLSTVGARIPASGICNLLCSMAGPMVSTSANLSGDVAPADFSDIDKDVLDRVDIAIDAGRCKIGRPSTIIDLTDGGKILRA